jgi:hypothetical protein
LRVVRVLDQAQQLAVVTEQALRPAIGYDRLEGANCQVSLPCPIEPTNKRPRDSRG